MTDESATSPAFGEAGLERDAGFTPLPDAVEKRDDEGLSVKEAAAELVEQRATESDAVVRTYVGNGVDADVFDELTRQQPKETVTVERAARDLTALREAEARNAEDAETKGDAKAVDADRAAALKDNPGAAEFYGIDDPAKAAKSDAVDLDAKVKAAFEIPQVKAAIEERVTAVEQERQNFSQAADVSVQVAEIMLLSQFPELAVAEDARAGVLAEMQQTNPDRYQQLLNLGAHAQQVTEQQAQARQKQAAAKRSAFNDFAKAQDAAFEKQMEAEPVAERTKTLIAVEALAAKHGLSKRDMVGLYNSEPLMRHAAFQEMMYKAGKYDVLRASLDDAKSKAVAKPLPPVQRPGVSRSSGDIAAEKISAMSKDFERNPSIKNAAAMLTARRRAAS